jgi:hypothetical protein
MRHPQTSVLAAAVALVFATVAQAATVPGTVSRPNTGPFVTSAPRITSPATTSSSTSANTTTTTTTTSTVAPTNTTTVDLRNQATLDATAGTHASGSTSALGPLANGTTSAGVNAGTGTGTTTGAIGTMPFLGTPIYANPSDTTLGLASSTAPTTTGLASTDLVYGNASLAAQGIAVTEAQANGVNVDRAINQVSRDRKRIGRNGQLLYSIAPRTNVDRSAQMPDDGPSPALTGSNSTLTR